MINSVEEFRILVFFSKKIPRRIHKLKNYSIWIIICGEIKKQNQGRKIDHKERENTETYKIWLIYCSKLKYKTTWRKIRKKTRNLTWNQTQNDQIHRQIKAFHFAFLKTRSRVQVANCSFFSQQNLDFKESSDMKMNL